LQTLFNSKKGLKGDPYEALNVGSICDEGKRFQDIDIRMANRY